jgi:hypothetical protein
MIHFFSPNPRSGAELCREKISKNPGRDDQDFGHLVQPVQLFESTKFRDWPTLTCYISLLVHAIGLIHILYHFVERNESCKTLKFKRTFHAKE